jgi:hypothetical protein
MVDKVEILRELKKHKDAGESVFKHCIKDGWVYNSDFTQKIIYVGIPIPFTIEDDSDVFLTGSICDGCLQEVNPTAYKMVLENRRLARSNSI